MKGLPMIRFECPVCNAVMSVPDTAGGRKGACPKCGQRLQVPPLPVRPAQEWYVNVEGGSTPPLLREAASEPTDILGTAKGLLRSVGKLALTETQKALASARQAPRAKPAETPARETSPFSRLAAVAPASTERQPTKRSSWALLGVAAGLVLLVSMCAGVTIIGLGVHSLSQMTWPAGSAGESKADGGSKAGGESKAGTHKLSLPFLSISKGVLDGDTAKIERVIHSSSFFMDMTEATAQEMAYEIRAVANKNPTAKKVEFKLLMDKRHLSDKYGNACPEDQLMGTISTDLDEARKYASDDDYVIRMKPFFAAQIRMMKHAEMLRPR